ncbi:MAG TPA: phenylalanine--tRNA ligase subunit beta [Trebonia sp.]|jgi:phenylalanyl-tRNA synthetase beta chain|nr:phenylalanine--tRNA ligase subunit beta [Trebonia sp.]
MRVPLSWLREYAPVPEPVDAADVARRLTAAGLEVETVEQVGHDIRGVVIGQVLTVEELAEFKKPIRYCRVAVSEEELTGPPDKAAGVICGAVNFAAGDRIAYARPGAVLPGGFEIGARTTYGRVSEGMICSAKELAIGEDHTGILVLPPDAPLGADFVAYAGLRDDVLEITVTPDRGYAVSIRGMARELATAYGVPFTDPAQVMDLSADGPGDEVWPASIADPTACDRFVLREVRGFNARAASPLWMLVRLARCGVRGVSLAVDVTNYLMLELGQPLHAFDRSKLHGEIVVRRARPGEKLETLDHVNRALYPEDILITDGSGPISMAGTMGGLATEIDDDSTDIVIEGAHFDAVGTAKMSRRHRLHSEASYRFERGVDRELPPRATARAVVLLAALGGGVIVPGYTEAAVPVEPVVIDMAADYPDRVAGVVYGLDTVVRRLTQVGCDVRSGFAPELPTIAPWRQGAVRYATVEQDGAGEHERLHPVLRVVPPSWRSDLTDPADLAEEVIRLEGYANVPVRMPRALAGHGLTERQRLIRAIGRTLGDAGFVEVTSDPFAPAREADSLLLPPEDPRRPAVRVANPLSDDQPNLRTTLLAGLFRVLVRNIGRGFPDIALFETGVVFLPRPGAPGVAPILATDRGPTVGELGALEAALPDQPVLVAGVLAGDRELPGWWGQGRAATWADAIEAARQAGAVGHLTFEVRAAQEPPWHPGRCAALYVHAVTADGTGQEHKWLAGHAGELHPRVIEAYGLPPRTCAFELDFAVLATAAAAAVVRGPSLSPYPPATQDVALVVAAEIPAADVTAALLDGAGDLLEDVRLFDVYTGAQLGDGRKSLAYTLRFRAPDRTLTAAEVTAARDAAVAEAGRRTGAVPRA